MKFLITGAARGIGRGLTRILLQKGHRVYLVDNDAAELKHTLSLCAGWSAAGAGAGAGSGQEERFCGRQVDLSDRGALGPLAAAVGVFFGGSLDVLVNNAMATPHVWAAGKHVEDPDDDSIESQWDLKVAVGLTAPFLLSRRLVGLLREGRTGAPDGGGGGGGDHAGHGRADPVGERSSPGCIVNVSSTRAAMAEPDHEAYSAVKAGLLGLTQSLAVSLGARHAIRVNAIVPGWINVDNESEQGDRKAGHGHGDGWRDGLAARDHAWHPAGRVGHVEDVAGTLLYLAESGFVTGEQITLDGGVTRKMVYPE